MPRTLHLAGRTAIGDLIRTARFNAGKSTTELAYEIDATANTITRWELGYSQPAASLLVRLVAVLPEIRDELLELMARADVA